MQLKFASPCTTSRSRRFKIYDYDCQFRAIQCQVQPQSIVEGFQTVHSTSRSRVKCKRPKQFFRVNVSQLQMQVSEFPTCACVSSEGDKHSKFKYREKFKYNFSRTTTNTTKSSLLVQWLMMGLGSVEVS